MKHLLTFILLFLLSGLANASEDSGVASFEKDLFTPQSFNYFGMGTDRVRPLTATQKRDLLEVKKTLILFLKATQKPDIDLSRFLGRELLARYKSRGDLLNKLLGQEIEILLAAVTEFELQQNSALVLNYYVVLFSEGNLLIREDSASIKKQGSNWKIVSIGGLK